MTRWDVAVIGGGPAGLMAAARAAQRGRKTILLDKNREPGVKILLSGGTRCNLTHATDARGVVEAFGPNGPFLYSALATLGPQQVVDLFEAEGVPTKVEPGGKVFPASDRALDIRDVLIRLVKQSGCTLAMGETLLDLVRVFEFSPLPKGEGTSKCFRLVTSTQSFEAEKVILATGGQSYPACGTTGDGYRFAAALGHRIVPPHTALVPVTSHAPWVLALQGITLPDVFVKVIDSIDVCTANEPWPTNRRPENRPNMPIGRFVHQANINNSNKALASSRGALLFAHFGVTGPVVLDVSHAVSGVSCPNALSLRCDLLPETPEQALDIQLAQQCVTDGKKHSATLLDPWLPHRVGETLLALAGIAPDCPAAELSKTKRRQLVGFVKRLDIPVAGTMGFRKAELTAGGIALEEVDSRTMQSRIVPNLYFAGELLDLNGPVGGYNFQAAFSTGRLAGDSV